MSVRSRYPRIAAHPFAASALGLSIVLAGCAAAPDDASGPDAVSYTACAVSGTGGWNDNSFNQQVYEGLERAKTELGVQTIAVESTSPDDFEPGFESLVAQGCDLIFSVGFEPNDAVNSAAAANPSIDFVTVDGFVQDAGTTNLKPVTYAVDQGAYLGGYLAAAYSKTHVLGTYGGINDPSVTNFMTGYYYGAQAWAEDNGTPTDVLGWYPPDGDGVFVGDFQNQVSAKAISQAQIDQGADVLFPVAGSLFIGTAEAIKDSGADVVFLGVDADVALTAPDYASLILTSVEKRMTKAVFEIIDEASQGEFSAEPYVGTLENEGTGLAALRDFESFLTPELSARLDELATGIIAGDIGTKG